MIKRCNLVAGKTASPFDSATSKSTCSFDISKITKPAVRCPNQQGVENLHVSAGFNESAFLSLMMQTFQSSCLMPVWRSSKPVGQTPGLQGAFQRTLYGREGWGDWSVAVGLTSAGGASDVELIKLAPIVIQ